MAETGVVAGGVPDEREGGLARRAIGFWGALAMSIAAMGPLLGALGVAPLIVSQAGFSAPFIFIICWIAMGTVAFTIGRFSGVLPGAASIYSYISHGLGEKVGFLSTWLSFGYYVLFVPLLLVGFGIFTELAFADVFDTSIDWWIWALIAAAIVFVLSIIGIRLSMRIDLVLALFADGFLVIVSIGVIASVISDGNFTLAPLSPTHAPGRLHGALARHRVRRAHLPRLRAVVRARRGGERPARARSQGDLHGRSRSSGSVLFLATFALVLGFGESGIDRLNELFGSEGTPWYALIREDLGNKWVDVLELVVPISILSNTIASHNSVVRIQYGMGRAKALPRQLGWTLPGLKTPYVAIIVQTVIALASHALRRLRLGPNDDLRLPRLPHRPRGGRRVHPHPARGAPLLPPRESGGRALAQLRHPGAWDHHPGSGRLHVVLSQPGLSAEVGTVGAARLPRRRPALPGLARVEEAARGSRLRVPRDRRDRSGGGPRDRAAVTTHLDSEGRCPVHHLALLRAGGHGGAGRSPSDRDRAQHW